MSEKKFVEGMSEISGFGGSYEVECRKMILNGVKWLKSHPDADPIFKGYENVYGICMADNEDSKEFDKAIMKGIEDATGAMHQAVISHIFFIKANGWDKYVEMMSND